MCCGRRHDDGFARRAEYGFLRSIRITVGLQMTNRGGGEPIPDMAFAPRSRMDPPPRSFAVDAYDCIMVSIRPDRPNTSLWRDRSRQWRAPLGSSDAGAVSRKARLAVHRPSACSGVKALRNTSCARRQRPQPPLAFRSLDPLRALREKRIAGDGTKNGLSSSEQRTGRKTKAQQTGPDCPSPFGNVTVTIAMGDRYAQTAS